MRAASLVAETTDDYKSLPEAELRRLVITNAPALKELRIGLTRECRVPLENSSNYIDTPFPRLEGMKRLALALAAEGRLAELERRTNDAPQSYVDAMRLGNELARGGLLIDGLLGFACESIGISGLKPIVPALDARQCRALSKELERIDASRESPEEILRNERRWSRTSYGVIERIRDMIVSRSWDPLKMWQTNYVARHAAQTAKQSQMVIDLASRAYELEKGRAPTNLNELVPDYLTRIPAKSAAQTR